MGAEPAESRMVEGVEYASNDRAPGLLFFPCSRLNATLSVTGCASRWGEARAPKGLGGRGRRMKADPADEPDRFAACRSCPIGATHAGQAFVSYSALFGADICPRCRTGTTRIIGKRICVSCYNREREMASGRNARGNAPTKLRPLRSARFRLVVDGQASVVFAPAVADMMEPVIHTLRTTRGSAVFSFAAATDGLRQPMLFMPSVRPSRSRLKAAVTRTARQRVHESVQGSLF